MAAKTLETDGVRIAVEGCGHGKLDAIYAAVDESCKQRGWDGVDIVIIGGDFQAARNAADLTVMAVPTKYRAMGDFHLYYSGSRTAPYLTIFIGGNHEAAAYLSELYHGGWVAPNIYYLGAANVLRLGPLRIAGMSGIWKGRDYRRPHHERLPFSQDDVRSFYHVREIDVRRLLLLRTPVDVGLSHDWPRGIERHGDSARLFRQKPDFRAESEDGSLGSVAAEYVMDRLRPAYWFSAHLHCKFSAVRQYPPPPAEASPAAATADPAPAAPLPAPAADNPDEIDLDLDDDADAPAAQPPAAPTPSTAAPAPAPASHVSGVSTELLAQLPASFARPAPDHGPGGHGHGRQQPGQPVPPTIPNTCVRFLALDKCLPGRHFLQLCEIVPLVPAAQTGEQAAPGAPSTRGRYRLQYDPEWLAITRVFARELAVGDAAQTPPPDAGEAQYRPLIDAERQWVEEHVVRPGKLDVPLHFAPTAPVHAPEPGQPETYASGQPHEHTNPQTAAFCALLDVPNLWDAPEEERAARRKQGPAPSHGGQHQRRGGGGRGRGSRGGGGGRGRGRY